METPNKRRKLHATAREQLRTPAAGPKAGSPAAAGSGKVVELHALPQLPRPGSRLRQPPNPAAVGADAAAVPAAAGNNAAAASTPSTELATGVGKAPTAKEKKMVESADEATTALLRIGTQLIQGASHSELKDQQIKSATTKCRGMCAGVRKKQLGAHLKHDEAKVVELVDNLKAIRAASASRHVLDLKPQVVAVNTCLKA